MNSPVEFDHMMFLKKEPGNLEATLATIERDMILEALKSTRGNMTRAAHRLGITERMMGIRVKKYSIEPGTLKRVDLALA